MLSPYLSNGCLLEADIMLTNCRHSLRVSNPSPLVDRKPQACSSSIRAIIKNGPCGPSCGNRGRYHRKMEAERLVSSTPGGVSHRVFEQTGAGTFVPAFLLY